MNILELFIIFLLLFIIGLIVASYLVNRKFTTAEVNFDTVDSWAIGDNDALFNNTNYLNTLNFINYVYDLYVDSITKNNRILGDIERQIQIDFLLLQPKILFTQTNLSSSLSDIPLINMDYYTPFGVVGQIENSKVGVISFRGTSNLSEWSTDGKSFSLIYPSKLKSSQNAKIGQINRLTGLNNLPEDCGIGEGWYEIYTSTPGQVTANKCVCTSNCRNGNCRIIYPNRIGKIVGLTDCSSAPIPCGLFLCDSCKSNEPGVPLCDSVLDYIKNSPIEEYIISGHSLGAAVAMVCAYHIESLYPGKVKCVYAFASPMVGNQSFVDSYNAILLEKTFRICNTNDPIPYLPGSFDGKSDKPIVKEYVNIANTCYTFTQNIPGIKKYSSKYHSLNESYKNSFDTIETNLKNPDFLKNCQSTNDKK